MEAIEHFTVDRHNFWYIHCGSPIVSHQINRDHILTKGLLNRRLPSNVPQVKVCKECNTGFSLDEEYLITFLSYEQAGSTAPSAQGNLT